MYSSKQSTGVYMYTIGIVMSTLMIITGIMFQNMGTQQRRRISILLSLFLFLYKLTEYTIFGLTMQLDKIPLEFSTITYFVYSISVLFNIKSMRSIAAFMGFVSGIGYLITFMLIGNTFNEINGFYTTTMAFINHSIVFLGSMLLLKDVSIHAKEIKRIMTFSMIYVIYVALMDQWIEFSQPFIFIRLLLGGNILSELINHESPSSYLYLLYFVSVFIIYRIAIYIFQAICNLSHRNLEV
jgi:hypothetical protein